ncbi:MAG TPA: tetratricopeptide repeat protein [Candidatus Dormibacteraeota bacterium]|jgi:TolA-binding protein
MDRQHRRELKHDRFVDFTGSLSGRAKENQRLLLVITAAVVAAAVIGYGIYFFRSSREQRAQDALAKAIDTIESPLLPATPTPGQPPAPGAKFKTDAERQAAAEKQFKDLQSQYGGSDAADVADLYLARIEAQHGNTASARKRLEHFVGAHPKHMLVGGARFSLYQLRIDGGEGAQVAQELQAQIGKADAPLPSDTMLVLLAHAYEAQGNADKSKEAYRRIVTEFPDSPYAVEAQRRVGGAA